ncbi:leucine-rich repeat protein kinase-like protein [Corchorus olitorius]|uniref:Leucine-rich repeat protein kinase-like protein n=1 Tax=Corchorus olitorius TaxID=93759 RepID=A0A1R3JCQ9_9ROSI|nr:leucine-rich repeat protein kinase-like protein [Corchorus olitorius]
MAQIRGIVLISFVVLLIFHLPSFQARKAFLSESVNNVPASKVLTPTSYYSSEDLMALLPRHVAMKLVKPADQSVPSPGAGN